MENTGSFGAAAGGISPELQAAIQSRGQGGATAAVTQGAPNFNPATQPPAPATGAVPGGAPMGGQPMPPEVQGQEIGPTAAGLPFDSGEAKLIIQALTNRLKALSNLQGV